MIKNMQQDVFNFTELVVSEPGRGGPRFVELARLTLHS